jgi:NADH-quinone oxidoreductase subunit C
MTPEEILGQMQERFGDAISAAEVKGVELRATVKPEVAWDVCRFLRDAGFEYLNCLSGVDRKSHLEVVYDLSSLQQPPKAHLQVPVSRDAPLIRTVTDIWPAANWHERECYDLFGIRFDGHPDHRRILLPEDWVGYPLRKDYADERMVPYTEYGMEEKLAKAEGEKPAAKPAPRPAAAQPPAPRPAPAPEPPKPS